MPKLKHVPSQAINRRNEKYVRSNEIIQPLIPSWRFSTVDKGGPFKWPTDLDTRIEIIEKLCQFDSMRWSEIESKGHHAIRIEALSKAAKQRLAEIGQDDIDEVFSFRCSGKARIIGIRDMNVVKLLWWDPEHQVCPSIKKHT